MSNRVIRRLRAVGGKLLDALDDRLLRAPFTTQPMGDRETYLSLFHNAREKEYPEVDRFEAACGHAIDREWLDELALHTQVSVKKSAICYAHGRVLYAAIRRYLDRNRPKRVNILETGTAKGFSALCMSRALSDANVDGVIVTIDTLPHDRAFYWNAIDDLDGKKTRRELLAPWREWIDRIVFLQGPAREMLRGLSLSRVNVAFLDAAHTRDDVLFEFGVIAEFQEPGDMVVFDDVTPGIFPGVVSAVGEIQNKYDLGLEQIEASDSRGYAVLVR